METITQKQLFSSAENFVETAMEFVKQYIRKNNNFVDLVDDSAYYYYFGLSQKLHSEKLYYLTIKDNKVMVFDKSLFFAKYNNPAFFCENMVKSKMDSNMYTELSDDNYAVLPTLYSIVSHILRVDNQFQGYVEKK